MNPVSEQPFINMLHRPGPVRIRDDVSMRHQHRFYRFNFLAGDPQSLGQMHDSILDHLVDVQWFVSTPKDLRL